MRKHVGIVGGLFLLLGFCGLIGLLSLPVTGQTPGTTQGEFWDHAADVWANRDRPTEAPTGAPASSTFWDRLPKRKITIRLFGWVFVWEIPLILITPPRRIDFPVTVPPVPPSPAKDWLQSDFPDAGIADDPNCEEETDYPDCDPDASFPTTASGS